MVMVGDKGLSAARKPMRQDNLRNGQKRQDGKKSIWTFLPSCREKPFPFPPKSTQAFSNSSLQGPSPYRKVRESTVSIQVQVALGTLFSRGCLLQLFPLAEAPAAPSRGSGAETATWR